MTNALLKAVIELACGFCVVWRIGGQKSHPEFHRVRGDCWIYSSHFFGDATRNFPIVGVLPGQTFFAARGTMWAKNAFLPRAWINQE